MTKKEYELIARTIKSETTTSSGSVRLALANLTANLTFAFREDNPRFDPDKFIRACGFDA